MRVREVEMLDDEEEEKIDHKKEKQKGEKASSKHVVTKKKLRLKKSIRQRLFSWPSLFTLLSIILSSVFVAYVINLDILPRKYLYIFILWVLFVHFLAVSLVYFTKKTVFKVIGWILIGLSILFSVIGTYYVYRTKEFLEFSFSDKEKYNVTTYYVLVKTSSGLIKEKISGKIGVYSEMLYYDEAVSKLQKKYSVESVLYEDIGQLLDGLNNDTEQFILVEKLSYDIVFSVSTSLKKEDYTIIYEFNVYTEKDVSEEKNTDKFNVYVGGVDFAGLMDFNMIVTVNNETHTILLTNIPRDYYIPVSGKGGRRDKLSFMKVHGANTNKDSLAEYFETKIDYSLMVNTSSLVTIVDYLGGIEFCSNYEYTTTHALVQNTYNDYGKKLHVLKGCQHLNGIETLTVARERKAFPGSDQARQENCQKILLAIIQKLMSTDTILRYHETLNTLGSLYQTDLPSDVITQAAKDILNNGNKWKIETQLLTGEDTMGRVYLSYLVDWVMVPHEDSVAAAKAKIAEVLG